ncbi:uncharacterized protein Hap1MRO34_004071 isoform 1-T2 [Clarias gariepinus]|uniref:uncharacterized protein LOC128519372 n=1 Tax=Clarias gariepinus TaxID=13013 RepID=UPI00234C10EC|nr:uncharacterized protein LOC128519372 [Clarias gariepinus]XP_053349058.1 uncharacterized protein LOC128519372 [Clarias gariepinus]
MGLKCFTLLFLFVSSNNGHTEFIYTKDEVKLQCSTNKWQISTESDNIIDVNCKVVCVNGETLKLNNTQNSCTNKKSYNVSKNCLLIARSGFFRCVTALDSGFLFPFKPSPNTVTSYIVATTNEEMTTKSEERSSVELTEGEDVLLNCSFNLKGKYDNQGFILYWIKTIGKSSSCVYSYDYGWYRITYDHHCTVQEELRYRISNQPEGKNTHNIRISNVTESDAGQYLCALQIQGKWKIIKNITFSDSKTKYEKARDSTDESLVRLCVILPILLGVPTAVIVIYLRKKNKTSSRSQNMELQITQHGNETQGL